MEESRQISEFNESMLQIQRLHNHWLEFSKHIKRGNFNSARWVLDDIEGELSWDAKNIDNSTSDSDKYNYVKKLEELEEQIVKSFEEGNPLKIYKLLRTKERLIREIQQESGKGARYRSEDEDTLL